MNKADIFWQAYLNLEKELLELSRVIFFTDEIQIIKNGSVVIESCNNQLNTFSPYIADLLVSCCVQIESISKELYYENGGEKSRDDNSLYFDEDCLKLIDIKKNIGKKVVLINSSKFNFIKEENRVLKPLKNAHKRQGTDWERAYQAVKHDRWNFLYKGTVKAFIHALAALYLLNIYYRNDSWTIKYSDVYKQDYSMGSKVFSVSAPMTDGKLWIDNKPIPSESPFVILYNEEGYRRIKESQKNGNINIQEYILKQPESKEPLFVEIMNKEKSQNDPNYKIDLLDELMVYRLNKKIPDTLSFEERKKRLISSEEYKGWVYQRNEHISPDMITEENIQEEINKVGRCWSFNLMKSLGVLKWIPMTVNEDICEICIL